MAALLLAGGAEAQKQKPRTGKVKEGPVIAGRHKIRQSDYDTFNKFTQFTSKDLTRYYSPFDYSRIPELTKKDSPAWGEDMQPVMNYLTKVSRATMTICALYAVNPSIDDASQRQQLAAAAEKEALDALNSFDEWKHRLKLRNKVQYKVAEVDYRYFKGMDYYNNQTDDETIHVGVLLYFGSKKKPIIDPDTTSRTFSDIRFFPNDADFGNRNYSRASSFNVENASYLCLRDASIYYDLPDKWAKAIAMKKITVGVTGNTLWYFTKLSGAISPETGISTDSDSNMYSSVQMGSATSNIMPAARKVLFNLKISF